MSITLQKILSYTYGFKTYEKGYEYYRGRRVVVEEDNGYEALGYTEGSGGSIYDWVLEFENDRRTINLDGCWCGCPAFSEYPGLCKHLVAAILACNDSEEGGLAGAATGGGRGDASRGEAARGAGRAFATTGTSYDLLRVYAQRAYRDADRSDADFQNSAPVRLEPSLRYDVYDGLRACFKIGTGKLFVVKNLNDLKKSIAADEVITLGSSNDIRVGREYFDEESGALADFISLYAEGKSGYDYSAESRKEIDLKGAALEAFFEIYRKGSITIERKSRYRYGSKEKGKLQIIRMDARIPVTITRFAGGIEVASDWLEEGADEKAVFLRGSTRTHILIGENLWICDPAFSAACTDLLAALLRAKLRYADEDAPAFFSAVFRGAKPYLDVTYEIAEDAPSVNNNLEVDEVLSTDALDGDGDAPEVPGDAGARDAILELAPPELVTSVYFDTTEEGFITARMAHRYGADELEAFGNKDMRKNFDIKGELRAEKTLMNRMGREFLSPGVIVLRDEDAIFDLLSEGIPELAGICEIYASDSFDRIKVRPPTAVSVGLSVNHRLLEMDIDLEGIDFSELAGVFEQYRLKKKYKRLPDGSFLPIGAGDSMAQLAELCAGAEISADELAKGRVTMSLDRVLFVDSILRGSETLRYERDESFRNIIRAMREVEDSDYNIPGGVQGVLRNYQITGYKWLCTLADFGFGGILADDMGLGKTLEMLTWLERRRGMGEEGARPSLVVCPASLVLNWKSEAARFTPGLRVAALAGGRGERLAALRRPGDYDLYVTSYGQMMRDVEEIEGVHFGCAILDEAQFIKNQATKSARAVKRIHADIKFALTGTPVENTLAELWSIFDFIMPSYLRSYHHFKQKYETSIVKEGDEKSTATLRMLTSPFILRRLKKDVLKELPEKTESVIVASMEARQRKVYSAMLAQVRSELADKLAEYTGNQRTVAILAALTRLRQICCDPSLVYENYDGGSAKLEACMELVGSCFESGHRMLLFSQFTSMLAIIKRRLDDAGIRYFYLDGATPKHERIELMNAFNEPADARPAGEAASPPPVFLISLKAGGTGLNLTGADIVIHYDPWWNLSAQNQATDRVHRIGQTRKVQVYKLIAQNSIEEKIIELQNKKAELADKILDPSDPGVYRFSDEELVALINER
ncbi:MAG: DEAD/DEAH box helicase [Clostridiales Family XIII bacterium]|nr:DEAD/DEAH box helicase [Clostridiales Family XIII bacterium]